MASQRPSALAAEPARVGDAVTGGIDYSELRAVLLAAVRRRCPRWLADQREDLVQDVLVKVMEMQAGGKTGAELPRGYLVRAAYNRLIDEIRRRRRAREVPLETEGVESPVPSALPGPERTARSRQAHRAVIDCLERLQRPRRLAVTLYLRGHSAKCSARLLGWPYRRVQNLVFRGVRDLRHCLSSKGVEL